MDRPGQNTKQRCEGQVRTQLKGGWVGREWRKTVAEKKKKQVHRLCAARKESENCSMWATNWGQPENDLKRRRGEEKKKEEDKERRRKRQPKAN